MPTPITIPSSCIYVQLGVHVLRVMFPARTILDPIIAIAVGALFVAYLRAEYLAPVPTEAATLRYPHEFGFPAWFSKGPSPHDVVEDDLVGANEPEERVLVLHGQSPWTGRYPYPDSLNPSLQTTRITMQRLLPWSATSRT
jgi:hypothetical protein